MNVRRFDLKKWFFKVLTKKCHFSLCKEWIINASKIFNGLDICALDVLKLKNGKEVILELNGTACGLMADHQIEDSKIIRDLVIDKMSNIYCK